MNGGGRISGVIDRLEARQRALTVVLCVATLGAAIGAARVRFDDVPTRLFRSERPEFLLLERVQRDFHTDENDVVLLLEAEDLFAPAAGSAIARFLDRLRTIDGIERVISLRDVPTVAGDGEPQPLLPSVDASDDAWARARVAALGHPLVRGHLLSEDARHAFVIARLEARDLGVSEVSPVLAEIARDSRDLLDAGGVILRPTGIPVLRVEIVGTLRSEQVFAMVAGSLVSSLIVVVLLRSLSGLIITGLGPVVGLVWTLGGLGAFGLPIDLISSTTTSILLVVGFTDSVHLALDLRHLVRAGVDPRRAGFLAVRRLGGACLLTSVTTAVGFASLAAADVDSIRRFGLITAAGTMVTFVAVILTFPLLAAGPLGRAFAAREAGRSSPAEVTAGPRALWALLDVAIVHPRLVSVLGTALTLALFALSFRLRPDNRVTEAMPEGSPAVETLRIVEEAFGGVLEALVLVEAPPGEPLGAMLPVLAEVEGILEESDLTSHALSLDALRRSLPPPFSSPALFANFLGALPPRAVERFLRPDLGQALVSARFRDVYASASEPGLLAIEGRLAELASRHPGYVFRLTGAAVVISRSVHSMIGELMKSLGLASIVIFGALFFAFRSLRFGLASVLPNLFPIVTAASALVLFDHPLLLSGSIVFSICLGIAVDDTIHVIHRYRRERAAGMEPVEAARRTMRTIASALLVSTAVLLGGFSVMAASSIPVLRTLGYLSVVALIAAFIGDVVLLPALLVASRRRRPR